MDPIAPTLNLPTPVNPERLKHLLAGYEPTIADFLFHGFKNGFSIHFEGIHFSSDSNNLTSATENPSVVDAKIAKELEAHRLAGPFHNPPLTPFRISPLGVVPKKNFGEFRLIGSLSVSVDEALCKNRDKYTDITPYITQRTHDPLV